MTYKWLGAGLIIASCGGVGFSMAAKYKREEKFLSDMITMLQFMESELQYHLTPLPELCRKAGREVSSIFRDVMFAFSEELNHQISPDVYSCMKDALKRCRDTPINLKRLLLQLGHTLGRFDLPGQLCGLQALRASCELELKRFDKDRDIRLRNYQTLGLCAGAALAILFV